MWSKRWGLIAALHALLAWRQALADYTVWNSFTGQTDPSNYIFYDPVDECNKSPDLCITSFKYCSRVSEEPSSTLQHDYRCPDGAKQYNATWIDDEAAAPPDWIEMVDGPRVLYSSFGTYTLKWQNNNPEHPTTVTWRSPDMWKPFYMYKVVDAGETELVIDFNTLAELMLPGTDLPANGTAADRNVTTLLVEHMLKSQPTQFTVGQPEDPQNRIKTFGFYEGNATDVTMPFSIGSSDFGDQLSYSQKSARGYFAQETERSDRKWRIGVGAGVGVGVPIVAAAMFFLGRWMGKREGNPSKVVNANSLELHSD